MGCGSSVNKFTVNSKYPGQDGDAYKAFQTIYLTDSEIDRLFTAFRKFDINESGQVSYVEFLTILDLEETPITREVFSEMDDSKDWNMTFKEFVLNMWSYCTLSKQGVSTFAFDIFDDDDNGSLNSEEIHDMIQRIYGKKGLSHDLSLIIKKMDKNKDGLIDKGEFVKCVESFPALLFPAYHLQTTFRQNVVDEHFWVEKQLQASSIRKQPNVMELFANRGGRMKRRKLDTKSKKEEASRRKSMKQSKIAAEYDGIDLGAHMEEEQIAKEHKKANKYIGKEGGKEISEDEAARVIQAAQIRKKNRQKRDSKKKSKSKGDSES